MAGAADRLEKRAAAGRDSLRDLRHVVFCSGESSDGGANPWRWLLFLCFLQDLLMSLKTAGLADQFHRSADARAFGIGTFWSAVLAEKPSGFSS
ncbi:hypothetical protein BRADI_1g29443v3 [Brachypodium distachyon]|uniref:Uncharacterized protein n=1 Tax=Brachypodium distachyon TaxID=15368 RepID=A0A2K2DLX8_BRADI|nr:hypothetical protein BRADI_1g29443v3 [Brachypodium distachyon]